MDTIRRFYTTLLLAVASLPASARDAPSAFERRCASELRPVLDVKLSDFDYKVNNTVSSRVLNNRDLRGSYSGNRVLGLTTVQTRTEVLADGKALVDTRTGRECVAPMLEVEVVFPTVDVYVAREFSPVSCSFRHVLAHEMRHVQLYRDLQPRLRASIRAELEKRFGGGPLYGKAGSTMESVYDFVDNQLRPMIREQIAQVEEIQKDIDSEEESYRLSGACQGEVGVLMNARF